MWPSVDTTALQTIQLSAFIGPRSNSDPAGPHSRSKLDKKQSHGTVPLRSQFKHDVVLTRVLDHLLPEIVIRPHFADRRAINLQRFDLLGEIGGVSVDVDYVANLQRSTG